MHRIALASALLAALVLTGCNRFFVNRGAYDAVKRAALVQYVVNPHILLGTAASDEVRSAVATKNARTFVSTLHGQGFEMLPLQAVAANPAYQAAGPERLDGYYTAPGLRFVGAEEGISDATLSAQQAKHLAAELDVDAVLVVYESWTVAPYALGFRARARPIIVVNMYDRAGQRIWGDWAQNESQTGMPTPGGIISTDAQTFVANFDESLVASLKELRERLGD